MCGIDVALGYIVYNQSMVQPRDAEIHHLIGGALCLDFANTLYGHGESPLHEYLHDYRDLMLWSRHAGILETQKARLLLQEADQNAAGAEAVFRRAIVLRERLYCIFANIAQARAPTTDALDQIHAAWKEDLSHSRLIYTSNGFRLGWQEATALDCILWRITDSAIQLLTSDELGRVKQCSGCDWLFVDRSRNHLRRWCSMDQCGNRSKMRRRYQRQKAQKPTRS
jgi:predicted RNA-binding Zn ribbon-like protein